MTIRPNAIALTAITLLAVIPATAHAVELEWDPNPGVTGQPLTVVVPSPVRYPRRYYVGVSPVRVIRPPTYIAPTRVTVAVSSPPPPATVVVDDGGDDRDRDPYDTGGLVVAGAGAGGLFFLGDGITHVAASYRLHLGLAVGPAEFALRFDLVPDAMAIQTPDGPTPSAMYTAGATFNYRFLPGATVHPVFGVGLESIILDPHAGETGTAFAVTARAGAELAYPLADGALALGIDVTGHHPFGATEAYASDVVDMLSFGAYGDYRF